MLHISRNADSVVSSQPNLRLTSERLSYLPQNWSSSLRFRWLLTLAALVIAADGLYKRDVFRMCWLIANFLWATNFAYCNHRFRISRPFRCRYGWWWTDSHDLRNSKNVESVLEWSIRLVCLTRLEKMIVNCFFFFFYPFTDTILLILHMQESQWR